MAKALIFLMMNCSGIYNIGYGSPVTINSITELVIKNTKASVDIEYVNERPGEIKHSYASIDLITHDGFSPSFSLNEGMNNTIQWYKDLLMRNNSI